jgi:hypothetical protein
VNVINRDGTLSRRLKTPCRQCGAMDSCDICWEHECDWSPFYIWHCFACRMPKAGYMTQCQAHTCEYCGWSEDRTVAP